MRDMERKSGSIMNDSHHQRLAYKLYIKRHLCGEKIEKKWRYAALDDDGKVYVYNCQPRLHELGFWRHYAESDSNTNTSQVLFVKQLFDECHWYSESLVKL
jgi:hypothetical protein